MYSLIDRKWSSFSWFSLFTAEIRFISLWFNTNRQLSPRQPLAHSPPVEWWSESEG